MPFLAPAMPFIGPAISAAGGLLGGILGGRKPKQSPEELAALQRQAELAGIKGDALKQMMAYATGLQPTATGFMDQAGKAFAPAQSFWSGILAGGPEATSMLAPEIQRIASGYDQAKRTTSQFAPTGGGRSSALFSMPFAQARDTSNLLATARPMAAQQLGTLGAQQGELGRGLAGSILYGLGAGSAGAGDANQSIFDYERQRRAEAAQRGGQIGDGIFNILNRIDFGSLFGKKGGGGGGLGHSG